MIDLEPPFLEEVKRILSQYVPDVEVQAFGSRITGKARKYSDLDLVLIGNQKLDTHKMENLKDAFALSNLPITVDILDWHTLPDSFQKNIQQQSETIQKRPAPSCRCNNMNTKNISSKR